MKKKIINFVSVILILSMIFTLTPSVLGAFESTYKNTGNQLSDIIGVAKTQVGYMEGSLDGTKQGNNNLTKYGKWYSQSTQYSPWSALFISWCAEQAEIPQSVIPKHIDPTQGMDWFKTQSRWYYSKNYGGNYNAQVGDIVYFSSVYDTLEATAAGLIYKIDGDKIYTIEGDTEDKCAYKQYVINSAYILGFANPHYSNTPITHPSTLSITGSNSPSSITKGASFSIKGTVSSNYTIEKVTVGIYHTNGNAIFEKISTPNALTFNIAAAQSEMKFESLDSGSYIYRITANDTITLDKILISSSFNVNEPEPSSTLSLSGATYPTKINVGSTFGVYGTITSNYSITSVTLSIIQSTGTAVVTKTVSPGAKTYNIRELDAYMTFAKLSQGYYTYQIKASDTKQANVILLSEDFTVGNPGNEPNELENVKWKVIDLSYWQPTVDWSKLAPQIDGAILRIGYTGYGNFSINGDTHFDTHYKGAKAQNLPVGTYYYSVATTVEHAIKEADFVIERLKSGSYELDMPVFYDMEHQYQEAVGKKLCTQMAIAFCERLRDNGFYSGIYCNKYWATEVLNMSELNKYPIWIAQYNTSCSYTGKYDMWQYTETGKVSGINGNVDLNECYRNFPKYIKANGFNGYTSSVSYSTGSYKTNVNMNLRSSASITSSVLTVIPASTTVTVTQVNSAWGKVTYSGNTGWMYLADSSYVTYIPSSRITSDAPLLNSTDALSVLMISVGKNSLTNELISRYDMNNDGKITAEDAFIILRKSVGIN